MSIREAITLDEQNPSVKLDLFLESVRFAEVETHLSKIFINVLIIFFNLNEIIFEGFNRPFLLVVGSLEQAEIVSGLLDSIVDEFLANLDLLNDFSITLHQVLIFRGLCIIEYGPVRFDILESILDLLDKLVV